MHSGEHNEVIPAKQKLHAGNNCSVEVYREIRRNDTCHCGSGKKAKHCCGAKKTYMATNIKKY